MPRRPLVALVAALLVALVAVRRRPSSPAGTPVVLVDPPEGTTISPDGGVQSVQAAELEVPAELAAPAGAERVERAYWRSIMRATAGLVRVRAHPGGRELVVLGARPLTLMAFDAPSPEPVADGVALRWPIRRGLLVARGGGSLRVELRAHGEGAGGRVRARAEVGVEGYRPRVAALLGRPVYLATQARVHVLVTHAFLRALGRQP
jgi:hypothetical protein